MSTERSDLMQFFEYGHLPMHLQVTSQPFAALAGRIHDYPEQAEPELGALVSWLGGDLPENSEKHAALVKLGEAVVRLRAALHDGLRPWVYDREPILRLILESKDCAVRARLFKA